MAPVSDTVAGDATRGRRRFRLSRVSVFASLIPIVTLLNAMVGMLLPQMMEPRAFGEYALVVTLFNYGLIFDLGISQIIDRRIPAYLGASRPDLAQLLSDKLLWLRLEIAIVAFLLAGMVLLQLSHSGDLPFSLAAGILAALAGLADMVALGPVCIYRARSARQNYAILIACLLLGLVIARLGGLLLAGVVGCFAALTVWYVTSAILIHRSMPLKIKALPRPRETLHLIREGVPFFATSFIWAFYVTGNRWIASFQLDRNHFGEFAFSANIFSLLVGAVGGFSAFYYPKIVELIAQSAGFGMSRLITRDMSRLMAASFGVVAVGILLAGLLIALIYPRYLMGIETTRVLLVAVPPMILASWLMPISLSAGTRPWIDGLIIYPTVTLILYFSMKLLYTRYGETGAAWASTVSAMPLIAMQLGVIYHARILRGCDAIIIFAGAILMCLALGVLAWGFGS